MSKSGWRESIADIKPYWFLIGAATLIVSVLWLLIAPTAVAGLGVVAGILWIAAAIAGEIARGSRWHSRR